MIKNIITFIGYFIGSVFVLTLLFGFLYLVICIGFLEFFEVSPLGWIFYRIATLLIASTAALRATIEEGPFY